MKYSFILKASTEEGYGHLIRSRSLANVIHSLKFSEDQIYFYIIGKSDLKNHLINLKYPFEVFDSEEHFQKESHRLSIDGVVIFDLLSLSKDCFDKFNKAKLKVSISPIFSFMSEMDCFFHRTKYLNFEKDESLKIFSGLEYTIIQEGCKQIPAAEFKNNLDSPRLSLAVSMGGGDAANKTLRVVQQLNNLKDDYTIWIMLGEGYNHSYDKLILESKKSHHEIILAKTNASMWKILNTCSLMILPGGITTYEATFVGLPTINFLEPVNQEFLINELLEKNVCDLISDIKGNELIEKIEYYNNNRDHLYEMHLNSKGTIDGLGSERIYEVLLKYRCKL